MRKGKKISGGKYHANRKSKLYEKVGIKRIVKLRPTKSKTVKVRGGNIKTILLSCDYANVLTNDKKTKIKNVVETKSDRFLARQNIMVKGAIIETELGKARITNRPGQEGNINAVLIE